MPLLSELREFKASFANVGGQKANLAAKKVPINDLKLPETEAEPMTESDPAAEMAPVPEAAQANTAEGITTDIDDLNFSDLISALPGDLSVPDDIVENPAGADAGADTVGDSDEQPAAGAEPADSAEPVNGAGTVTPPPADDKAGPGAEDLYFPDELLSNLSDKIEPVSAADPVGSDSASNLDNLDNLKNFNFPPDAAEPDAGSAPELAAEPPAREASSSSGDAEEPEDALDLSVFDDLGDFGDLAASKNSGLPEEPAAANTGETPDFGDLGLPEEPAATDAGVTPDFGDLGLPEEPAAADAGETPDFGDLGLPEEPAAADAGETPDFGDLDLPEEPAAVTEGEVPDFSGFDFPEEPAAADAGDTPDIGDLDFPAEPAAADAGETPDFSDIDALGDLDLPAEPAAADAGETPDFGDLDELGDFDLPGEPAAADAGETPDLDALGDFDLPGEPAAADAGDMPDLDALGDSDLPKEPESAGEDDSGMPEIGELDDLDTFGDFGLPEEPTAAGAGETTDAGGMDASGDFDLPGEPEDASGGEMPDFDLPEGSDAAGEDQGINLGNLDEQISVDGMADTPSNDIFEDFDPSGGVGWEKDAGEGAGDAVDSLDDIDDIAFPDLDNIVGESQKKAPAAKSGKAGRKKDKRKGEIPIPEKEDDIELNSNELRYLQETLSGYPLNLRIACEEIIAEQDVRPEQMVRLIRNLIRGAPARETAALASEILERPITVPKSFEKSSVEALEAEKSSFAYIFFHNFLPVMRLVTLIAIVAGSIGYLTYKFVYIPLKAESIYQMGYERIPEGEYQRANERFDEAFNIHRKKKWFFKYAEAFIKERQYIFAEQKYDELLRYYPRDKLGVLSYAQLETKYLRNYEKADSLLRHQILDYNPDDPEALLALGDNSLAWGEIDPSKYEDARFAYARLLDKFGQLPSIMERMLKYFIRTDNLKEVLPVWQWFNFKPKERPLGAETLSELGGYFLDKQLEEVKGVPNEYVALIDDVREILLRAVGLDPSLPEPHYHLARYYKNLDNAHEERITLEIAIREFKKAEEGPLRRITNRIDAYQRYADNLINGREFLHAEDQLLEGIKLYDDAIKRRLLTPSPQYGRLHAGLGDLEYFVKTGNMEEALRYYNIAQQNGWAPPDMRYRMGVAHYKLEHWQNALENFVAASQNLPQNRRILFALGNAALKRGDYFVAQGYYSRLLDILENHRSRLPLLLPNDRPEYLDLAERLMKARNNAGVANEMLAARTGNRVYHTRAMGLYSESQSAWDSLTRNPGSWDSRTRDPQSGVIVMKDQMIRSASTPLPFLNMRNVLYPRQGYEPQMFMPIDREASESSRWEQLVPPFKD